MECWNASYARSSSSGNSTVVDASSSRVWLGDPGNAGITEPAAAATITAEAGVFQARMSSRNDSTNGATQTVSMVSPINLILRPDHHRNG